MNYLRLDGRSCKLIRSEEQYRSIERTEGMIAYNGQEDNLIDRFDGRALLDFYRDPVPSRRQKSEEELELQEVAGPPNTCRLMALDLAACQKTRPVAGHSQRLALLAAGSVRVLPRLGDHAANWAP